MSVMRLAPAAAQPAPKQWFTNPWWVVAGALMGLAVCNGPLLAFTFGVFLKPIVADTHWQRATVSFALSLGAVLSAVALPPLGRMMDRWGIRRVALPGLVVFAICMGALALTPRSLSIFILFFAITGIASAVQTPLAYAKAISAWFDNRRGLALGIAMAGVGVGAMIVPQIARLLIERVGWRGAYASLGAIMFAIAFPAVALWIREPQSHASKHQPSVAERSGANARQASVTARFWALAGVFFFAGAALNGTISHIVPLLTDRGMPTPTATAMLAVMGLSTLVGRPLAGYLVDRIFAPYVATAFFLAPFASFMLLATASGPLLVLGVAALGLALGAEIDLIPFLTTRYLGQCAFGEIYGYFFMAFTLGTSSGQFLADVSFDRAGSYTPALIGAGLALLLAIGLVNSLGPYTYRPRHDPKATMIPTATG
jgi:predicted MFS family arabinose efflux permease